MAYAMIQKFIHIIIWVSIRMHGQGHSLICRNFFIGSAFQRITTNESLFSVLVTCRGAVNSTVGTVMSLTDLQRHMKCAILDELHEKNLNLDVQFFKKTVRSIAM